jgi:hypothetical protein
MAATRQTCRSNRKVFPLTMDLDPSQYGEADRREVDPPIEVESATWSAGGTLDWWVRGAGSGSDGCAVQTVVNGGSKLLIFVGPKRLVS